MIKTMHIGEFKAKFSEVVGLLKKGFTIKVIKGRAGEVIGYFSNENNAQPTKRELGIWADNNFSLDPEFFEMSDDELNDWGV